MRGGHGARGAVRARLEHLAHRALGGERRLARRRREQRGWGGGHPAAAHCVLAPPTPSTPHRLPNAAGELFVLDGASLARLHRLTAHELFITRLLLLEPHDPEEGAADGGGTEPTRRRARCVVTCGGENVCKVTRLPELRRGWPAPPPLLLAALVLALALLIKWLVEVPAEVVAEVVRAVGDAV